MAKRLTPPEMELPDLMLQVLSIPNPQRVTGGKPGEAALADFVCAWLDARAIPYTADLSWGIHAVLDGPNGPSRKPGVLLAAHMDSDVLDLGALSSLRFDNETNAVLHTGDVGLDCKTGVAIALMVLERLRLCKTFGMHGMPEKWSLHVLFTVGEESGQKGALRAPLSELLAGRVRHGIVIDRKSRGSAAPTQPGGGPLRHVVTTYKGVPLLDKNSGPALMGRLQDSVNLVEAETKGAIKLKGIESPNCSDALELRGRWDAEVVGPWLLKEGRADENLKQALHDYECISCEIRQAIDRIPAERRVSSMNAHPRFTRYQLMQQVRRCVAAVKDLNPILWFSCVNLSYDYDEDWGCLPMQEIDATVNILTCFISSYFADECIKKSSD